MRFVNQAKVASDVFEEKEDLRNFLIKKRLSNSCKISVQGTVSEHLKSLASKSWMGISNFAGSANSIQAEIGAKGVFDIEIRELGNRVLVINCADSDFEDRMIEEGWCWLSSWLTMVHGKENLLSKGGFYKWIKIQGVPIHGWNAENFEGIANIFGSYLFVHPETFADSNFISGTVLIHCQNPAKINECISLQLDEEKFCVQVSELELSQIPPILSKSYELSESGANNGEDFIVGQDANPFGCHEDESSKSASVLKVISNEESVEDQMNTPMPESETGTPSELKSDKMYVVSSSGNGSNVADSEETISTNIRFSKKKKKGGKKLLKGAKRSTIISSDNHISDESIARQTFGPTFEGAIAYCKKVGFNTKGREDLLRDHLFSLNDTLENWQTDKDQEDDPSGDSEETEIDPKA